jgi:hypothetical protein
MRTPNRLNVNPMAVFVLTLAFTALLVLPACNVNVKKDGEGKEKKVDIETPMGALHVANDADIRDVGLAVYPNARKKEKRDDGDDGNENNAHINISSSLFGLRVVAIEYLSDDPPAKLVDYYKTELKKYGSVLECHTNKDNTNATMNPGDSDDDSKLKCENDQNGKTTELKVGTEQNQHIVSIKPGDDGKGSDFGLVYVRMHKGKDTI